MINLSFFAGRYTASNRELSINGFPKTKSCEFEQIICPLSQDLYFDAKVTK